MKAAAVEWRKKMLSDSEKIEKLYQVQKITIYEIIC